MSEIKIDIICDNCGAKLEELKPFFRPIDVGNKHFLCVLCYEFFLKAEIAFMEFIKNQKRR